MKRIILFIPILCLSFVGLYAQWNPVLLDPLTRDSILMVAKLRMPQELYAQIDSVYKKADEETKTKILLMLTLPQTSKSMLIENIKKNKTSIFELEKFYNSLLNKDYNVILRIIPPNYLTHIESEAYSIIIQERGKAQNQFSAIYSSSRDEDLDDNKLDKTQSEKWVNTNEWHFILKNSTDLIDILEEIGWSKTDFDKLVALLKRSGCVGIGKEDCNIAVNFAQKDQTYYSYLLFPKKLIKDQKLKYNDKCIYIYYNENIVLYLQYGFENRTCFEKN